MASQLVRWVQYSTGVHVGQTSWSGGYSTVQEYMQDTLVGQVGTVQYRSICRTNSLVRRVHNRTGVHVWQVSWSGGYSTVQEYMQDKLVGQVGTVQYKSTCRTNQLVRRVQYSTVQDYMQDQLVGQMVTAQYSTEQYSTGVQVLQDVFLSEDMTSSSTLLSAIVNNYSLQLSVPPPPLPLLKSY